MNLLAPAILALCGLATIVAAPFAASYLRRADHHIDGPSVIVLLVAIGIAMIVFAVRKFGEARRQRFEFEKCRARNVERY